MPKRRDDVSQEVSLASEANEDQGSKPKRARMGVYVPFNEDGTLDTARVKQPELLDKARSALGTSTSTTSNSAAPAMRVDRDLVPVLVDGYAMLLQQATRFMKWPSDARKHIAFTVDAKERLKEPVGKVLDKYAPALLSKNQELAACLLMVGLETKKVLENAMAFYVMEHPELLQPKQPVNGKEVSAPGDARA